MSALAPVSTHTCHASSAESGEISYACILGENTFFYTARDEKQGLFLLPKTYYVKILEPAPDYCKIEYLYDGSDVKKVVGYAKTSELTLVDYTPTTPYLHHVFTVDYLLNGETGDDAFHKITLSCTYYGDYIIGSKTYCYVLRGNEFGYVPKPTELTYPLNDEYANRLAQETFQTDDSDSEDAQTHTNPALIALLVALCLLVPVLSALVLKPPKKPPYETED